jgi:hypothetical protein
MASLEKQVLRFAQNDKVLKSHQQKSLPFKFQLSSHPAQSKSNLIQINLAGADVGVETILAWAGLVK